MPQLLAFNFEIFSVVFAGFGANSYFLNNLQAVAHIFYLADAKELVRSGIDGFAHGQDHVGGGHPGERRGDDFVTGADARETQRDLERLDYYTTNPNGGDNAFFTYVANATAGDITIINFGMGSATAATVT